MKFGVFENSHDEVKKTEQAAKNTGKLYFDDNDRKASNNDSPSKKFTFEQRQATPKEKIGSRNIERSGKRDRSENIVRAENELQELVNLYIPNGYKMAEFIATVKDLITFQEERDELINETESITAEIKLRINSMLNRNFYEFVKREEVIARLEQQKKKFAEEKDLEEEAEEVINNQIEKLIETRSTKEERFEILNTEISKREEEIGDTFDIYEHTDLIHHMSEIKEKAQDILVMEKKEKLHEKIRNLN